MQNRKIVRFYSELIFKWSSTLEYTNSGTHKNDESLQAHKLTLDMSERNCQNIQQRDSTLTGILLVAFDRLFIKCMNIKRRINSNSVSEVFVRAPSTQVNDNKSIHWKEFGVWDEYKILVRCPDQWTNSAARAKWMLVESELSAVSWPLEKRNGPRQNGNQIEAFGQTN